MQKLKYIQIPFFFVLCFFTCCTEETSDYAEQYYKIETVSCSEIPHFSNISVSEFSEDSKLIKTFPHNTWYIENNVYDSKTKIYKSSFSLKKRDSIFINVSNDLYLVLDDSITFSITHIQRGIIQGPKWNAMGPTKTNGILSMLVNDSLIECSERIVFPYFLFKIEKP